MAAGDVRLVGAVRRQALVGALARSGRARAVQPRPGVTRGRREGPGRDRRVARGFAEAEFHAPLQTQAKRFGAFVPEASTLDGQALQERLRSKISPAPGAYLRGYGNDTAAHWTAFSDATASRCTTPSSSSTPSRRSDRRSPHRVTARGSAASAEPFDRGELVKHLNLRSKLWRFGFQCSLAPRGKKVAFDLQTVGRRQRVLLSLAWSGHEASIHRRIRHRLGRSGLHA